VPLDVGQQLGDLRGVEEEAVPQLVRLLLGQPAPPDPLLDLVPGQEGRPLVALLVLEAAGGGGAGQEVMQHGPVPDGPEGGDLLLDGPALDEAAAVLLLGPLVAAALEVGGRQALSRLLAAEDADEVLLVQAVGGQGVGLQRAGGQLLLIIREEPLEGQDLRHGGLVLEPAAGEDELPEVGVWGDGGPALLDGPQGVPDAALQAVGLLLVGRVEALVELFRGLAEAEKDAVDARLLVAVDGRHRVWTLDKDGHHWTTL
jgi:hypothetical protein